MNTSLRLATLLIALSIVSATVTAAQGDWLAFPFAAASLLAAIWLSGHLADERAAQIVAAMDRHPASGGDAQVIDMRAYLPCGDGTCDHQS